jgi:hypothetical protein
MSDSVDITKLKSWGQNALDTVVKAKSAAITSVTDTAKNLNKAFSDAKGLVTGETITGQKPIKQPNPWTILSADNNLHDLFMIGRPCKFNQTVDQYNRFGNYLRSKMSVIDLLPVDYSVDYRRMADMVAGKSDGKTNNKISIYSISYINNIELYKKLCDYHGLKKYAGIRLFTTDDTTASDTIQVQYKDSTFQGMSDSLSGAGQNYRDLANSLLGSNSKFLSDKVSAAGTTAAQKATASLGGNKGMQELIKGITLVASDMVMKGNKMTFPKIWQSSSYNSNLSVNIKLVSPYGHPEAVKEFILKPLSYLILLAAPQTINGVTFGGNIPISIKAYGLNYTVLGSLASLTFRRGGSDSSFNLYRQPLTIDVSIEFQTLFDAFAVFDPSVLGDDLKIDRNIFNDESLSKVGSLNLYTAENRNNIITSLGTILSSLRPIRIIGMENDPQVYGVFEAPSRTDIPDAPSFTPLTGNLGSTISGAVSSIGNFANMVTNAPKLIQQGLTNAVYNTAKGTVASIAKSVSGYVAGGTSVANGVRNKIVGNLF